MELSDLLKYLIDAFERLGIRYFITGSMASMFYGEPRFTNDIDVVADIKEEHLPGLLKLFPEGEFYLSSNAVRNAIKNRSQFNIIHPASGLKVDVAIPKDDAFDKGRFKRVKTVSPFEGTKENIASPEDVIVMKMKYYKEGGSEKHLRDIAAIMKISGNDIDRGYIESWAKNFDLTDIWESILNKIQRD